MLKTMNDPSKAGQLAGEKRIFGEFGRYAVAPVHTRFDALEWFVWDAERKDDVTGGPTVIRQASSCAEAINGLQEPGGYVERFWGNADRLGRTIGVRSQHVARPGLRP